MEPRGTHRARGFRGPDRLRRSHRHRRAGHAVAEYLGQLGNPIAQRHIAILYLLADVPIERVYELVTDPDRATDGDP